MHAKIHMVVNSTRSCVFLVLLPLPLPFERAYQNKGEYNDKVLGRRRASWSSNRAGRSLGPSVLVLTLSPADLLLSLIDTARTPKPCPTHSLPPSSGPSPSTPSVSPPTPLSPLHGPPLTPHPAVQTPRETSPSTLRETLSLRPTTTLPTPTTTARRRRSSTRSTSRKFATPSTLPAQVELTVHLDLHPEKRAVTAPRTDRGTLRGTGAQRGPRRAAGAEAEFAR